MNGPPTSAAWRHLGDRDGFEVVFLGREDGGLVVRGQAAALEDEQTWGVRYAVTLDEGWVTRRAHVVCRSAAGLREVRLEADGAGRWRVDGAPAPHLDGCLDVDLEASAFTNAFPVRRLALAVGARSEAPAAYVRSPSLAVERLEQSYLRLDDDDDGPRFDYASPRFDFRAELVFDRSGLVLDYPEVAVRVA
jgi:hypothetical protein